MSAPALPTSATLFGHALRPHWSLDPSITFLNHGSYGATPRYVQMVQRDWHAQMESEPVRFMMDVLPLALSAAGAALAGLVGAKPENLVFVDNATALGQPIRGKTTLGTGQKQRTSTIAQPNQLR